MNKDAHTVPELTERQLHILSTLIRTYIRHPEPISSKQLVEENDLNVSSATVRNELAMLEQLGMIRAPHTSAGRVPTEEGYRYFVQHLLTDQTLSVVEQRRIRAEFDNTSQNIHKWLPTAASILARRTNAAALVTEPRARTAVFKHLQLIGMHGQLVLLVLVLEGGELMQHMLTLTEIVDQERLTQVAAMINDICHGETAAGIRQKARTVSDLLAQEAMEFVSEVLSEAESGTTLALHWYGFSDLLPKLEEGQAARQALRILDEKKLINELMKDAIASDNDEVKVIVAGDGRIDEINELSIVVSRYGTYQFAGAISVLGPIRMRYGRAISTVRYVSNLMTAMMQDLYGTEE